MSLIRQSLRALTDVIPFAASRATVAFRPAAARFSSAAAPQNNDDEVVVPELHQTLEWILESPPPLHQFEEAPIVIETFGPVDPTHH
ncbi:TPA: hypothetical protein N0F65_010173 [Lagenidium giganteum]|uniref:Uncharacterized protein n=1 Tax=Lagenidium giganteum TaxID=4803 RepID=A0AAV2Z489_9STRA|nr:TPA: hypothetical protein N0F65_010173 [Lagenidium giganteum]